jgi:hypothetical protein
MGIGTTQGIAITPVTQSGSVALAALKPLVLGANPLSFNIDKPWSIPEVKGPGTGAAIANALAGVIQAGYKGYKDKEKEKKDEDIRTSKDWVDWQKFEEQKRHNQAIEGVAAKRIKEVTPEDTSDFDEFSSETGWDGGKLSGRGKYGQGRDNASLEDEDAESDVTDPTGNAFDSQMLTLDGTSPVTKDDGVDLSGNEPISLKFNVKPISDDPRLQRDAKPNPDLPASGGLKQTKAQLAQLAALPTGPEKGTLALIEPVQGGPAPKALQNADQLGGILPGTMPAISEQQKQQLLSGSPLLQRGSRPAPAPADPIVQAIAKAAQEPLPLAGTPTVGPSNQTGRPQMKMIPYIPFDRRNEGMQYVQQWNKYGDPNMPIKTVTPNNKRGGWDIHFENITKDNLARAEREKMASEKAKFAEDTKRANISIREGNAVISSDDVKNYTNKSGLRLGLKKFVPAYLSQQLHPEASGPADVDLMDTYARAMSGGVITEGQAHLIQSSRSLKDKLKVLAMKPEGGDILSQGQRDQMLRAMLEAHNATASSANQALTMARERMVNEGVTDERYLPQMFVDDMILKKDAEAEKIRLKEQADKLLVQRRAALAAKNSEEAKLIEAEVNRLQAEALHLHDRLKKERYSGIPVLGYNEFKTKKQGFLAGTGGFNIGHKDIEPTQ